MSSTLREGIIFMAHHQAIKLFSIFQMLYYTIGYFSIELLSLEKFNDGMFLWLSSVISPESYFPGF